MSGVYTNLAKKRSEQSNEVRGLGPVPHLSEKPDMQEEQDNRPSSPVRISPVSDMPQPHPGKKQSANGNKPTNLQTSKSLNALQVRNDKFDKYSTYLRPGFKKELKSIALERDCKDYEVLDEALSLFFQARKK
jgi:hypothetical protein